MFEILLFLTFAVLCGLQPLLVKWFMPTTVKRNVVILCQELVKLIIGLIMLLITSPDYCIDIPDWTFRSAIWAAGVPSIMFVIQNHCNLLSNQMLQPVTFVVLNQTKFVWTALWCYILLKQSQSKFQIIALLLVIVATLYLRKILPLCCCCSTTAATATATTTSNSSSTTISKVEVDNNSNSNNYDNNNKTDSKIITSNERSIEEQQEEIPVEQQLHVPLLTSRSQSKSPTNINITKNIITTTTTINISININNNDVEDNNDDYDENENDIYEVKPPKNNNYNNAERLLSLGVTMALFASFLSGLSGSITQLTLQVNDRNPHLFNIELSIISIALLIISTMGTYIFGGSGSSSSSSTSASSASSASSSVSSKSSTKTTASSSPISTSSGGLFIGWTW
jgi:hypothetical protein